MRRPKPRESARTIRTVDELPLLCTSEEAAILFRCNPEAMQRMARKREIPAAQINRRWIFKRDDLITYFDNLISGGVKS